MEDKRVRKTKQHLKQTALQMLEHRTFEQLTVKDLCAESDTSRITFYTHYADKYDLMDDVCADLVEIARRDYHRLQLINNEAGDAVLNFCNLFNCILNLFVEFYGLFQHTVVGDSPYLNALFDRYLLKFVKYRIQKDQPALHFKYPPEQTAGVLIHALWGFLREGRRSKQSIETIRTQALQLLQNLLRSNVLTQQRA